MTFTLSDNDALIVVDMQNDFCPGGALAVPDGDTCVPVINRLIAVVGIAAGDGQGDRQTADAARARIHVLLDAGAGAFEVDAAAPRDDAHRRQDAGCERGRDQVCRGEVAAEAFVVLGRVGLQRGFGRTVHGRAAQVAFVGGGDRDHAAQANGLSCSTSAIRRRVGSP